MMKATYQAPEHINRDVLKLGTSIFLAGGISGTHNWQKFAQNYLLNNAKSDIIILNPRREYDFDKTGEEASNQIQWEANALSDADIVLFWFPSSSLCPIALFELGTCLGYGKEIYIGCDIEYQKRFDLETQLPLYDYSRKMYYVLHKMLDAILSNI